MSRQGRERAGRFAEILAAWLLRLRGYRILARRYATPLGEIDLVARRGDLLGSVSA
jgi:putative endonuclease